jgi:hypothetical protein
MLDIAVAPSGRGEDFSSLAFGLVEHLPADRLAAWW